MADVDVLFTRTNNQADIPIIDGQLVFDKTAKGIYLDDETSRILVGEQNKILNTIESCVASTDLKNIAGAKALADFYAIYSSIHPNSIGIKKDITTDIYDGNLRTEISNGNLKNVKVGNYIIGRTTGTKYFVVHIDYLYNNRDSGYGQPNYAETNHHLCIMPQWLIGVSNLLWTGESYRGSGVNNTHQGVAPWNLDNTTVGAYTSSYMYTDILPKVYQYWLKADFEDHGIRVFNFYSLDSNAMNANTISGGYSGWQGASSNWGWNNPSHKCVLPTIQNITGSDGFSSSGFDVGVQKEQLAFFKIFGYEGLLEDIANTSHGWSRTTWCKNVASSTYVCDVYNVGHSVTDDASCALGVRPLACIG